MKLIQVGVGGHGGAWLDAAKKTPEAEIVGLVDISQENVKNQCRNFGLDEKLYYPTLKDALKHVKADGAVVVTPPRFHCGPVVEALEAGLHVISEKPMAEDMGECKKMVKAALKAKRIYMVGQNYRYGGGMWTLGNILRSGRMGQVGQVKVDFYLAMNFGGFRQEMEYPLIVDMSIHHFDLIRFVTGLNPVDVSATGWNPVWSHYKHDCSSSAVFRMDNGAHVLYNGSWCSQGTFSDWNGNWQIECEKGTVVYEHGKITIHHTPSRYHVTSREECFTQPPSKEGQAYLLDEFIQSAKKGSRPATVCFDNIYSIGMVLATVDAMRSGKRVPVLDAETRRLVKGR